MESVFTFEDAFEYFRAQINLSPGTIRAYGFAIDHFYTYLEDSELAKSFSVFGPDAKKKRIDLLGAEKQDVNILMRFITHLGTNIDTQKGKSEQPSDHESIKSSLKPATIRLYGQAIITIFRFLADELLLPETFPIVPAIRKAQRRMRDYIHDYIKRDNAPEPPKGIEKVIHAFDDFPSLQGSC